MKKRMILALTAALLLGFTQAGYAEYISGFKVVEVTTEQVVIQKGDAEPVKVMITNEKFKVGDKVKFDAAKNKVKKIRKLIKDEGC